MTAPLLALNLAAMFSAVMAIVSRYVFPQRPVLFYVFKPLTTLLLLTVAGLSGVRAWSAYNIGITVGLVFSLLGDIWLMLPADRFLLGLVSFLFAHLSYGFALVAALPTIGFLWPALPLSLVGALTLWYLWPTLPARRRLPVGGYLLVISLMASLAVYRVSILPTSGAWLAAVGAGLFLTSDVILALAYFRRPFYWAQASVLSTYYVGQLLIALSVWT